MESIKYLKELNETNKTKTEEIKAQIKQLDNLEEVLINKINNVSMEINILNTFLENAITNYYNIARNMIV